MGSKATTKTSDGGKVKTLPGGKQTTLFGLPAPKLDDSDKKSRKRKPSPDNDEISASSSRVASSSKAKLEAFRSTQKPASAATGGLGAEAARELPREGEELEETQLLDNTQEESMPLPRTDSELQPVAEEAEDGDDDTQMSETQIESQTGAPDSSVSTSSLSFRCGRHAKSTRHGTQREKENERPSGAAPAASKLAQFAFKKAPVADELAEHEAEATTVATAEEL